MTTRCKILFGAIFVPFGPQLTPKWGLEFWPQLDFEITATRWQNRAKLCTDIHLEVLRMAFVWSNLAIERIAFRLGPGYDLKLPTLSDFFNRILAPMTLAVEVP